MKLTKRSSLCAVLVALGMVCFHAVLSAQTVTVTASNLQDGGSLANGTIYWSPVLTSGAHASYHRPGGGIATVTPVTATVVSGVMSLTLPDTTLTTPANICFSVKLNTSNGSVLGPGFTCVQPHGTSSGSGDWCAVGVCNFDAYAPNLAAQVQVQPGPAGPAGPTGAAGPAGPAGNATIQSGSIGQACLLTGSATCAGGTPGVAVGGTGATTAAAANLAITGVTQTGTLGTSSQVSTFPGTVAAPAIVLAGHPLPSVYYDVLSYGAVADVMPTTGYLVASLSVGSTTLTCSTCGFTAAAVGKYVAFQPWYNAYVPFATTPSVAKITGYLGPTQVTLDKTGAVTANFAIWWGTDNVPAFNACAADAIAKTNGGTCWIPAGNYLLATFPYSSITGASDDGSYGTPAGGSGGTVTCTPTAGALTSGGCVVSGGTNYKHNATLQTTYASGGCSGYLGWGYGSCGSGVLVTAATNSSGVPTAATVVYGGTNITSPVVFNVTPLGGDGASATATETGGTMNTPTLTAGGDGYAPSGTLSGYILGGGCTTYQIWRGTPIAGTVSVGTNASGSASGTITVTHNATGCTSSPTIIFGPAACNTGTIGSPVWGQCSNVAPLNPIALPVQVLLTPSVNFNGASGAGGPGTGVNLYGTWDTLSVDNYEPAMFGGIMQYEDIGQFTLQNGFLGIAVTNNANYSKIHDIGFNTAIGMWTGATDLGFVANNLSFGGYASWINGGAWSTREDFPLGNGGFFDAQEISNIIVRVAAYGGPGSISQQLDDWFANNFWRPEFTAASTDIPETCKFPQTPNQRMTSHSLSDAHQANDMCYRGISSLGMAILTRDSRSTGGVLFNNLDVKQASRYIFYGSLGGMEVTNIGGEGMTPIIGTGDPYRNATTQEGWIVYTGDGSSALNAHPSITTIGVSSNSNVAQTLWDVSGIIGSGIAGMPGGTRWFNLSNSGANTSQVTQNPDFLDLIQFPVGAEIGTSPYTGENAPFYFDAYYGNASHRSAAIVGEFGGMEFLDPTLTTDWLDVQGSGITTHVPLNAPLYFSALGGSPGMTANLLAVYQGATGLVGTAGTGATNVVGIANSSIGSPYGGVVLSSGIGTCVADNTVTIGNLIGVGTTTAGRCKDLGTVNFSAVSQALQIVGVATTGASAGGTFTLQFFGPGYYGTSVAGSSPLTTKGDLFGYNTAAARIPVGADTYVLTADSTQALGVKWAAAPGASSIVDDGKNITTAEVFVGGNKTFVTGDFTDSTSGTLMLVAGLSFTLPTSKAVNVSFHCKLLFDQGTAAVSDSIGIGVTGTAPTQANASATAYTNTTASTNGTLAALASTTPTAVVTFTPSAITTIWSASLDGTIEQPSNATPGVFGVYVSTTTGSDNFIVKRGSYCTLF